MNTKYLQHALSWLVGKIAYCRWSWLKNWLIRRFIAHYKIDLAEAAQPDINAYPHFNAFFVRELRPGLRIIDSGTNKLVSPVDGIISQMGAVQAGQLLQAKGIHYALTQLLTPRFPLLEKFSQAKFAVLYLAPKNYHRVHMPVTGQLTHMIYVPGALFSVNERSVQKNAALFARNERVITLFNTEMGAIAVILVGALLVRSISLDWHGLIAPNAKRQVQCWDYANQNIALTKGQQLGQFHYGSTVIVLCANKTVQWEDHCRTGQRIVLGQSLGVLQHIQKY